MKYGTLRFRAEPDVNNVSGFTEALALAAGGELSQEQIDSLDQIPDRSIANGLTGLTESPEDQPRDDSGRFEPAAAPAEEAPEGTAPETPETPAGEPSIVERLEKQLADSQQFIGRLSTELGQLRQQVEAPPEKEETPAEPAFFIPTEDQIEELEDQLSTLGGPALMARVGSSHPEQAEAALAVWKASGDPNAWIYEKQVDRIVASAEKPQVQQVQLPPEVEQLVQRERLSGTLNALAGSLDKEEAARLAPHLDAALQGAGKLQRKAIGEALASDDAEAQKDAFEELVGLARVRAAAAGTAATTQRASATKEAKSAARVATGSQRVATPGQATLPGSKEEFEKLSAEDRKRAATLLVAKQFDKTNSTSVQDGLTGL